MYCRKCGNKLLETSNFCPSCGARVIRNTENNVESKKIKTKSNILSMDWYKTFQYFIIPLMIIIFCLTLFYYDYSSFYYDKTELGLFLINIAMIVFFIVTCYSLGKKFKNTFKLITTALFIQCIYISSFIVTISDMDWITFWFFFCLSLGIWFAPNFIYFNKRKNIFNN